MIVIEEINSYSEALRLKDEWNGLVKKARLNLSLDFDFVMSLWEVHLEKKDIVLLVAKEEGNVVGIFPLFMSCARVGGVIPVAQVGLLTNLFSLHNDLICEDKTGEVFSSVLEYMNTRYNKWHEIFIGNVLEESTAYRFFSKSSTANVTMRRSGADPYIDLKNGFDSYIESRSWSFRRNAKRKAKKLEELGNIQLKEFHEPRDVAFALEKINEIENESWKENAGISIDQNENQKRFYKSYLEKAALNGNWESFFLCVNGEYSAFKLLLTEQHIANSLKTAYKSKYDHYSLGFLIHLFVIKKLCERQWKEYDLLTGVTTLKQESATGIRNEFSFFIYNSNNIYAKLIYFLKQILTVVRRIKPIGVRRAR